VKEKLTKFKAGMKKTAEELEKKEKDLKVEQANLESLKVAAVTAKLKEGNQSKAEIEISSQVTKITEIEATITRFKAAIIDLKGKITNLTEERKKIKFNIEIKVLEAKEAENAVMESIKTVTNVELLNRKRWIASKTVGDYKKCQKYMGEFKMIYEKQAAVIAAELNDHARRMEVAQGAVTSLKERKELLKDAKKSAAVEADLAKNESETERHTKVQEIEEKVIAALKEKKEKNLKEYEEHVTKCDKTKSAAIIATSAVNDAATTLKNQREYQVQVTDLKNILVKSHEEALTKRSQANEVHQNFTMKITKYQEQVTVTQE
jgi:hypothetical protein